MFYLRTSSYILLPKMSSNNRLLTKTIDNLKKKSNLKKKIEYSSANIGLKIILKRTTRNGRVLVRIIYY